MKEIKQAVVLAGGLGTRLKPFTDTNPKPMYEINGVPFIGLLMKQLCGFGITDVLLLLGYMPEKIMNYLGDGSAFGLKIQYDVTPVDYDTGARLSRAKHKIAEGTFLLMYCDNYCPADFSKLLLRHSQTHAKVTVTAYANDDGYTKSNLKISENGCVEIYDKKRITQGLSGVDIGYAAVDKSVLELIPDVNCNFEAEVYPKLVSSGELFALVTHHRYYSVGSYERIKLTEEFFLPKKTVFLDRDGTLCERPPKACYVENPEDFKWLPGAAEAVKLFKDHGFTVILITNQPGIARGSLTYDTLDKIHEKMQYDLKGSGTEIDDIFYCAHNWDEGCFCRKPLPGMLYQAQKKYSLDLTQCFLVGDDERDIIAGQLAGCKCRLTDPRYCTVLDAAAFIVNGC